MSASEEIEGLLQQARGSDEETWPGIVERFGPLPETLSEQMTLIVRKSAVLEEAVRTLAARLDELHARS